MVVPVGVVPVEVAKPDGMRRVLRFVAQQCRVVVLEFGYCFDCVAVVAVVVYIEDVEFAPIARQLECCDVAVREI